MQVGHFASALSGYWRYYFYFAARPAGPLACAT